MTIVDRPSSATATRVPAVDVAGIVMRLGACVLFLGVGATKFEADSYWVRLFAQIGLGDWFRYLTGALQIAGGVLFLVPRATPIAAVLTGSTMLGAIVVHFFVLHTGIGGAIFPIAILGFIAAVTLRRSE